MSLLEPSQAQQKAWQLLGYKRYIPRCVLRDLRLALKMSTVAPPTEEIPVLNSDSLILTETDLVTQKAEFFCSSGVTLVDCVHFTLLYQRENEWSLCFPALWFVDGRWRLFMHDDEWDLLLLASKIVRLEKLVSLLEPFREFELFSPRFSVLPQKVVADLQGTRKHIVYFGAEAFKTDAASYFSAADITWAKISNCVHPYLAMQSAQEKKQFWHGLLALKKGAENL